MRPEKRSDHEELGLTADQSVQDLLDAAEASTDGRIDITIQGYRIEVCRAEKTGSSG